MIVAGPFSPDKPSAQPSALTHPTTRSTLSDSSMMQSLLRIASDGLHVLDPQGNLLEMSDSFCALLGYTRSELLGKHVAYWDAKWPQEVLIERIQEFLHIDEATFETIHRRKDGQFIPVEVHIKPFLLDSKPLLFCSSRDISHRKQSEDLIRLQADALKNSVNGIAISDARQPDSPLIYVNPAFERITGYRSEEVLGKNCRFLQGTDREQPDLKILRAALQKGQAVKATLRNYRKDGTMFWNRFQISPVQDQEGALSHYVAIINDITERKSSDDFMRLVSQVFLYADESIFVTDPHGRIVEVNPAFTRTTGYTREEVLGQNPNILQSGRHEPRFFADMWAGLLQEGHWSGEIWNRRKNGDIYPDKLTVSVVRNSDGETLSYVCISSDISVIKAQQAELELMALHDALTGLPNRALLNDRLSMALADARRSGGKMAVCFIDLDDFKPVNDTHGHETGDQLLKEVAHRLTSTLRATDTVARLGGDEFILILSELDSEQEFVKTLTRIMTVLSHPYSLNNILITISASVGVTVYPEDDVDAETLLRHADQAMYLAKEAGRNRFHFFDVVDDRKAHIRSEGRTRIETALENQEFILHYQPKVNLRSGKVVGLEALIRWNHPQQGLLSPAGFLPLVENSDLETRLSEWVLREAMRQMAQWHEQGLELAVSVNLPARHLHADSFSAFISGLIAQYPQIPPERLELEVLENVALWDIPRVTRTMTECRSYGVLFSIDDFGTGYASLAYLRRLPVNTIKIDQNFIRDMLNDADDLSIVEGVISLADAFQKAVIAEGMETVDHGNILLYLGCELAQGYGISKPLPADQIPEWVSHYRPAAQWASLLNKRLTRQDIALAFAEVWHRRWVDTVILSLENETTLAPPLDPRQCSFGEWLQGNGRLHYAARPEFQTIDRLHEAVHVLAQNLFNLQHNNAQEAARAAIPHLLDLRNELLQALNALIAAL